MASNKADETKEATTISNKTSVKNRATKTIEKQLAIGTADISPTESKSKPKIKIVRDFSMPQVEYHQIAVIKKICLNAGVHAKRSLVLRAGLKVLSEMTPDQIICEVAGLSEKNESLDS